MKDDESAVLELNHKTDLLSVSCECPQCGKRYPYGVSYVQVPCDECGITYRTDFKQDIYTKKSRQLQALLSYYNSVRIIADEDYEAPLVHARHHLINQHCWDVSEIERGIEVYRRCSQCGICFTCLTCKECNEPFQKKEHLKKQKCPKCGSNKFKKTRFDNVEIFEGNKVCPHCKSDNIKMSRTTNKVQCHYCHSKKLTEPRNKIILQFTVERKKAYRKENV